MLLLRLFAFAILPLLLVGCGTTPRLFRDRAFTSESIAQSVNYFVRLGEEGALAEFEKLAAESDEYTPFFSKLDKTHHFCMHERIGWMCRILYEPKGNRPLRPPFYGSLALPYRSMPEESWPLYPVAKSGETYFSLSEGYSLAGEAEDPLDYLAYCREAGTFRKIFVEIPTKLRAQQDAARLKASAEWKALKWKDSGHNWSYTVDEEWVWKFIQQQADLISD